MATRLKDKRKYTYEDYLQTPDNERYELIEGDLLLTPSPNTIHQWISGQLGNLIRNFVNEKRLGKVFNAPLDVVPGTENVFQPDILFISRERYAIITDKNIYGAPDLVIEILSPSSAYLDLVKKNASMPSPA